MPLQNSSTFDGPMFARRVLLAAATVALLVCAVFYAGPLVAPEAEALPEERTLSLYNLHTKESITVTFKRDGRYIPSALAELNRFLRDWRRDVETRMDPELIDLVWELGQELGVTEPIHVISGYRSQETNDALRRTGRKVARRSQHIQGKAMDVYFPGVTVEELRNSALVRQVGGVGYYPRSGPHGFVHVDTGNVRHWPRLGQQQLARIFQEHREHNRQQPREERTPVYLADNGNGQDRQLAEGSPTPANTDFPLPLDKPVLMASAEPEAPAVTAPAEAAPQAADTTRVATALPQPSSSGDTRAPVQIASAVQAVTFTAVSAPEEAQSGEQQHRSLMFFPLAIMRNDQPAAAPALLRQASFVPTDHSTVQQVVPMRGTMTDELSDEEVALIATLVPAAQPPRQLSSSELARLAHQTVDRNGKGPLLMSQHTQPVPTSEGKDGKLDAPDTIIDLINGTLETAAVPADTRTPQVRLGLGDALSAPGDSEGEQPLAVAEGLVR